MPYMVLFYQSLDFTGAQIGVLTGITPLISLVSVTFWTGIADRTFRHKLVMNFALLVGITGLSLLPFLKTFPLVLIYGVSFSLFFSPASALADSASMYMLGGQKELIGRVRLGGTIGFGIFASVVGVVVAKYGLSIAFWAAAGFYFIGFLISQRLVHGGEVKERTVNRSRLMELIKNPEWIIFLVSAFTCGFAFAASNTYLFPFMKGLGAKESTMGLALTVGTIAEIPVLLFINRVVKRIDSFRLLMFSMIMTGVRLFLFAAASSPTLVLVAQLLNGFAYPITWVAGVSFADEKAPAGLRATAQGLFSGTSMGFGSAVGGFAGGIIFERLGGRGLNLTYGATIFVVVIMVWLIRNRMLARSSVAPGS